MKIACGYRVLDENIFAWVDKAKLEGFTHLEMSATSLPADPADADRVVAYAKESGFSLSIHAPFGKTNITSPDPAVRAWSIERVSDAIRFAARHGIDLVVLHPGRFGAIEGEAPAEENLRQMTEILRELAQLAKDGGVRLALENMEKRPNEIVHSVKELNYFAPLAAEYSNFGVTMDFSHYLTLGEGLPDLAALELPLFDVHLSQTVEGKPHFTLERKDGIADLSAIVKALTEYGYGGPIVLEVREGHGESYKILSEVMEKA